MRNVCGEAFKTLQLLRTAILRKFVKIGSERATRSIFRAASFFGLLFALTGCGGDLQKFHVLKKAKEKKKISIYEITKHEVVDEGSGIVYSSVGPGTYTLQKITVGGAYLRRTDLTDGVDYDFKGGIHGNPEADQ